MTPTEFSITVEGSTILVKLRGELDMQSAPRLDRCLNAIQSDTVIDCSGLDFIDSSGIRAFVEAHQAFAARGNHLTLRDLPPLVQRLVDITGLSDVLDIE
jgi:anti-sigma B factor antagonist